MNNSVFFVVVVVFSVERTDNLEKAKENKLPLPYKQIRG